MFPCLCSNLKPLFTCSKINNRNTVTMCKICSKFKVKTAVFLVSLFLTLFIFEKLLWWFHYTNFENVNADWARTTSSGVISDVPSVKFEQQLQRNIQQIFLVLYVTLNRYLPAGLKFLLKTHSTEFNIDATGPWNCRQILIGCIWKLN